MTIEFRAQTTINSRERTERISGKLVKEHSRQGLDATEIAPSPKVSVAA